MLYMDGKAGAQNLLDRVFKDPALMAALAEARAKEEAAAAAAAAEDLPAPRRRKLTIAISVTGDSSWQSRWFRKPAPQVATHEAALDDFTSLLQKEFKAGSDAKQARIEQAVKTMAQQALEDTAVIGQDVYMTVDALKAAIDRKLTEQVNLILHHPEFQALESAWRGLWYLVGNTSTGKDLKIRVLNISKEETRRQLRQYRDAAWDQSPLFKRLYEQEFGQLGGQPYGAIICDYSFNPLRPRSRGHEGTEQDRRGGACAVHRGSESSSDRDGQLAAARQSARHRQAIRRN